MQHSQVAVAHLHNCGLVNADIKPDNILLCNPPGQIPPFFLSSSLLQSLPCAFQR
jgi:serine/threonine protein kinase